MKKRLLYSKGLRDIVTVQTSYNGSRFLVRKGQKVFDIRPTYYKLYIKITVNKYV